MKISLFFCNCPVTLQNLRLWAHERTPGIPRNVHDLGTVEFADVLGAIAEDQHLTRCAQVCFTGTEEDQAEQHDHGTIDEFLGDQDKDEGGDALEEADREADLIEQMPLPGHPKSKKNVWHLGFVFLANLASLSDDYVETNDYRKKLSCRCYVLPGLHKTISAPPIPFDAGDATTQSRDLKHTKCLLDLTRSITKWESTCSRSSIQLACASQCCLYGNNV